MQPKRSWTALLVAVAYLLPLVVLPTLHVVQEAGLEDCARCAEELPDGPRILGEGSPCDHHHHHHPDRCQICQTLAQTPVAVMQVMVAPVSPTSCPQTVLPVDSGYQAEILTPLCRGPPVA